MVSSHAGGPPQAETPGPVAAVEVAAPKPCPETAYADAWDLEELTGQASYLIEQGPPELRAMAGCCVGTSCLNSLLVLAGCPGSGVGALRAAGYLLAACQVVFAITAAMFEAELSWVQRLGILSSYQDMLLDRAPHIAQVQGRGAFYFLQGVLWIPFASLEEPQHLVVGAWLAVVGLFQVCAHYGIMPRELAVKMRVLAVDTRRDPSRNQSRNLRFMGCEKAADRPMAPPRHLAKPHPDSGADVPEDETPEAPRTAPTTSEAKRPENAAAPAVVRRGKTQHCCVTM